MRDSGASKRSFTPDLLAALNAVRDASYVPKLTYFDTRGRGEVIRLILEQVRCQYNERRIRIEDWPGLKSSFAFAHLPVYQEGDLTLTDADAICRHLARKHDLYGDSNLDHMRCDIVHETIGEELNALFALYDDANFESSRGEFERIKLPEALFRLESFFETNKHDSGYWAGQRLSYVDLMAWHYLDSLQPLAPAVLTRFPKLAAFKARVESLPQIAGYLASERRPGTLCWPLSRFGATPDSSRS